MRTQTTRFGGTAFIVLTIVALAHAGEPGGSRDGQTVALKRVAQVHFDPGTNATFTTTIMPDGSVQLTAEARGMTFRKAVFPDGRVHLQLERNKQQVSIQVTADAITIASGRRSVKFDPRRATENDYLEAKALLAASKAVAPFRSFLAALESAATDTPSSVGVLLGGSLIAMLDGDVGAPSRVGRRLALKRRGALRAVRMVMGCYSVYESEVSAAWNDLLSCIDSVSIFWERVCEYRWFMWVESAWFTFVRCSAFSW